MSQSRFQFRAGELQSVRAELLPLIRRTPLVPSQTLPGLRLKAENLQLTGSFKVRPAFSQILALDSSARQKGIVTSSSGNFAQAVAFAAKNAGISAKIVMMKQASPLKVERTRARGGEVVFCEDRFEARARKVEEIVREEGRMEIHPYDHPRAILGNATMAMEILEQHPAVQRLIVPVSGGGLIAGIAVAVRELAPSVQVWGVQPELSNATFLSFRQKRPVSIPAARSVADGLTVTTPGSITFPLIQRLAHGFVTVSEESILEAVRFLALEEKLVVEPSGAVTVAAAMQGLIPSQDSVCILSGGNLSAEMLKTCLGRPPSRHPLSTAGPGAGASADQLPGGARGESERVLPTKKGQQTDSDQPQQKSDAK